MADSRSIPKSSGGRAILVVVPVLLRALVGSTPTYVDAGSGSFIFQAIIGGLLAAAVVLRAFWGRLLGVFRREPRKPLDS